MKKAKNIALIILSVIFSVSTLLFAASCGKNNSLSAFFKGAADTITFGDSIFISEYLEDVSSEYTLVAKKGESSTDITGRTLYTPDEPGEWTLICTVESGAYKGTSEFKLSVKPEALVWSFTAQNKLYDKGDTLNFEDYFASLKIQCDYYYDYTVKMDYVAVDGIKEDLTNKTEYTFTQTGEHVFKFHIETEDGVKRNRSQIINVKYISETAQTWFDDNNVEYYNAIIADQDSVDGESVKVVLDKGTTTGSSWTTPVTTTIPYVAFSGSYGLNDYVVVEFTGRNMPQFAFFCDEITSSAVDNKKGIYVSNGNTGRTGRIDELDNSRLTFYGPYKVYKSYFYGNDEGENPRISVEGSKDSPNPISNLALDSNTRYKVIFGFKNGVTGSNGQVTAVIRLINLDTEGTVYDVEEVIKVADFPNKSHSFTDGYFNGNIILYGNIGRRTTFDKVYNVQHFDSAEELNEYDKFAQFKATTPNSVIIANETEFAKFIDTTDKEYTFTATHEDGDVVNADVSKTTFALNKIGKWTLAYKIKDYLDGDKTVSVRTAYKTVIVYGGDEGTISWMKKNDVTVNRLTSTTVKEDNTFVMSFADMWMSGVCSVSGGHPYIALNGDYGAGTFVSLDFVGKAMPYVSFFNKKVTDSLVDGEEGMLFVNGMKGKGIETKNENGEKVNYTVEKYPIGGAFVVMAPKKAESGNFWSGERIILDGTTGEGGDVSAFNANALVDGTNYRLVLGITNCATGTGAYAQFTVNAMLINVDTNECVAKIVKDCNLSGKITQTISSDYFSGSIVIYGSTFGETTVKINSVDEKGSFGMYALQNLDVEESTQTWITKNSVKYYNAESIATDGTITLAQNKFLNSDRKKTDAPYLAIDKDINFINTAVSIDFAGKNMPFIGLAQENLTSSWTNGTKGMLISNGFYDYNDTAPTDRCTDRMMLFKMNNMPATGSYWDSDGNRIEMNSSEKDANKVGVDNLDESTNYRLVLFIEKNAQYGWQLYYRLFSLKTDGNLNATVLSGNVKIGGLTDYPDATFTGKLVFWSATHYQAKFKINGIYKDCNTNDLRSNIPEKDETFNTTKNTFFN